MPLPPRALPLLIVAALFLILPPWPALAAQRPDPARAALAATQASGPMIARYPAPLMDDDPRAYYTQALVELAFSETPEGGTGYVVFSSSPQERLRMEAYLEKGSRINLLLLPGTNAYDARFLRVDLPVDRGLLGLRVGVIRSADRDRFAAIHSLGDLSQIRIGSVLGWQLTDILRHNGLTTEVVPTFDDLYKMLDRNRLDLISRGATEVLREQAEKRFDHPDAVVDSALLLRLPLAFYIYVSPTRPDLHRRIETGLQRAVANGRFAALFQEWFGNDLDLLALPQRHIIDLSVPDPHLPTVMMRPALRLPLPAARVN